MRAAPKAVSEFQLPGVDDVDPPLVTAVGVLMPGMDAPVTVSPNATSAAIAINFRIINKFCVVLPARTPRQLIIVRTIRTIVASKAATLSLASISTSAHTYFTNISVTATLTKITMNRRTDQPYTNA